MMDTQLETLHENHNWGTSLHDSETSMQNLSKQEWLQLHAAKILEPWSRWPTPLDVARTDPRQNEENIADIYDDTINLKSDYEWLTYYIWLPEEFDVADVDPDTTLLNGEISEACFDVKDELHLMIAKFPWSQVEPILILGEVEFTVSGKFFDGTPFECSDTVIVKDEVNVQ